MKWMPWTMPHMGILNVGFDMKNDDGSLIFRENQIDFYILLVNHQSVRICF